MTLKEMTLSEITKRVGALCVGLATLALSVPASAACAEPHAGCVCPSEIPEAIVDVEVLEQDPERDDVALVRIDGISPEDADLSFEVGQEVSVPFDTTFFEPQVRGRWLAHAHGPEVEDLIAHAELIDKNGREVVACVGADVPRQDAIDAAFSEDCDEQLYARGVIDNRTCTTCAYAPAPIVGAARWLVPSALLLTVVWWRRRMRSPGAPSG